MRAYGLRQTIDVFHDEVAEFDCGETSCTRLVSFNESIENAHFFGQTIFAVLWSSASGTIDERYGLRDRIVAKLSASYVAEDVEHPHVVFFSEFVQPLVEHDLHQVLSAWHVRLGGTSFH